jgi:uncharacterized protein YoxC
MEKLSPIDTMTATMFKHPVKYDMLAIIIYLIGMEIENLIKQIREKAQETSKLVPKEAMLTPEQIEEAKNDFTGFIKKALQVIAERQKTLNAIYEQLQTLERQHRLLDDSIIGSIENSQRVAKKTFPQLVDLLQDLKGKKNRLQELYYTVKDTSNSINELLQQHANEWKEHQKNFAEKLIEEFAKKNILLSDIEKQELIAPTKTPTELLNALRKAGIIKT